MKKFIIEKDIIGNEWITFKELNELKEEIKIEIVKVETDLDNKSCLMYQWVKKGYIKEVLPNWWNITVYATSIHDGSCWGKYNPQTKINKEGRHVINFFIF